MHMADALISPAVGGTAWAAAAGLIGYSSRKLRDGMDDRRIPLMAVLGAFIFAAQMINFTIPATGSSGHLGGGLILAILLGPYAGFLTLASVLIIQALFFADGGLLALGCNIFNLGFLPCFIAYPLIYRKIVGDHQKRWRVMVAALTGAVAGLQLGSLAVVTQTYLSGISELPFGTFLLIMQPIHLAIGLIEGFATAAVILFVLKARPEIFEDAALSQGTRFMSMRGLAGGFLAVALFLGVGLSWFASTHPDGLEWSISRTTGTEELEVPGDRDYGSFRDLQGKTAILPDYAFKEEDPQGSKDLSENGTGWPAVDVGTSVSGLVGGILTLLLAGAVGFLLKRRHLEPGRKSPTGSQVPPGSR